MKNTTSKKKEQERENWAVGTPILDNICNNRQRQSISLLAYGICRMLELRNMEELAAQKMREGEILMQKIASR